jgi:hypothetical protein
MDDTQQRTVRTSVLDEIGDLYAEKGSRAWAIAVRHRIRSLIGDAESNAMHLQGMIEVIKETEGYRQLEDREGVPFASYESFCVAGYPWGLGYDPDVVAYIVAEREAAQSAQARAAAPKERPKMGRPSVTDESRSDATTLGRGADYLTKRIEEERPDILERMKTGEYPSVRRAAMDAGIVKPTVTHGVSADAFARAALKHLTDDQIEALVEMLEAAGLGFLERTT